jgi:hypothetical protein
MQKTTRTTSSTLSAIFQNTAQFVAIFIFAKLIPVQLQISASSDM